MRTIVVASLAALLLSFASLAQPLPLRIEKPVSAPELTPLLDAATFPRVATNGEGYVAMWTDMRGGEPRAYAARFKQDGTRLDPLGIHITPADYSGTVVWNGSVYLLIYIDGTTIYSRTLDADGLLGTPKVILETNVNAPRNLEAATNGASILVVGASEPGLLLDLQGNKLKEIPFPWDFAFRGIDVASAGGNYLVVAGNENAQTMRVASDGSTGALRILEPLAVTSNVSIASDGENHLVVWSRDNLEAQTFDAGGNPTSSVRVLTSDIGVRTPVVTARGSEYFITFADPYTFAMHGMRVSSNGLALSDPRRTTTKSNRPGAMTSIGSSGVAIWTPDRGGIEAAFFDEQSVAALDPFRLILPLADTAQRQFDIHLARLANGSFVAGWIEETPHGTEVRVSRGPGSVPVSPWRFGADRLVDLVVDDHVVWVITSTGTSIDAQRLDEALQPIDADPVRIATGFNAIAAGGEGNVLVVFQVEGRNALSDLASVVLKSNGAAIEKLDVAIPSGEFEDHHPAAAFDGRNFVVTWARAKSIPIVDLGHPAPPDQVVSIDITTFGTTFPTPHVDFDASTAIVALYGARGARGVAFVWQTEDDLVPQAKYAGELGAREQARALETDEAQIVAGLEAHGDGFVLIGATSTFTGKSYLQEIELLTLSPFFGILSTTSIGTSEAHNVWRTPDADVLGGTLPVFAYARLGSDAEYGGVSRVFVQQTASAKRRAVR